MKYLCKDCDHYQKCEYYHNRKGTSKICSEFEHDEQIAQALYEAKESVLRSINEQIERITKGAT